MTDRQLSENAPKFHPKKSLGQNFLTSPIVPGWLCEAATLQAGDAVLEIGPGTGVLTRELLKRGGVVTAVETDSRAILSLKATFTKELRSGQLKLISADIKDFAPEQADLKEHSYKLVANIPYYLSGWLLRTYLSGPCQPSTLVFLLQKELVERIVRDPKSSLLSLSVKAYGSVKYVRTVSRGHFNPSPQVDSAILAVTNINRDHFKAIKETDFFHLLHLGLGRKRKQLMSNLGSEFKRADLEQVFNDLGFVHTIRGEDLALADWLRLVTALRQT